jgi:hypothetical protein
MREEGISTEVAATLVSNPPVSMYSRADQNSLAVMPKPAASPATAAKGMRSQEYFMASNVGKRRKIGRGGRQVSADILTLALRIPKADGSGCKDGVEGAAAGAPGGLGE